jgi:hypothetical protein
MSFTEFKNKFGNVIFTVTAIGALVTLIGYISPIVDYASDLNKLVNEYEQIHKSMQRIETHIDQYESDRTNKKKTFSIGLRSDTENGQMIYVDENNGIYRAFLDPRTKEYFYYDSEGHPIYCYSQKPVRSQEDHIEIKPIIMPTAVIVQADTIQ